MVVVVDHPRVVLTKPAQLAELVREARTAAERTGGALDPTVGGALHALGYDRDIKLVLREGTPPLARLKGRSPVARKARVARVPGWRRIHVVGDRLVPPPGTQLDLSATAMASAAEPRHHLIDPATAHVHTMGGWPQERAA